jgi:predicted regulator of Ras-like GTPase activity (Roadblock/LC7/MglB family)
MSLVAETETWSGQPFGDSTLGFCLGLLARFSAAAPVRSSSPASSGEVEESVGDDVVRLEDASQAFEGQRVEGVRALVIVSLDGQIEDQLIVDQGVDAELLAEYATLVRIAYHTSEDAGSGALLETTWSSEAGTVLSRHVDGERFLVLIGGPSLRTSLARYVLRQAAKRMLHT